MRFVLDVLVRVLVAGGLSWLAGWLMTIGDEEGGGANIGAGLVAFAVLALVAFVWSLVDSWRSGRFVRTVLVWLFVGILVGVASAFQAQGWTPPYDTDVLTSDLIQVGGFMTGLTTVPAIVGAGIGALLHRPAPR